MRINFLTSRFAWMFLAALCFSHSNYAFVIISNRGKPAYWPNGQVTYRFNTTPSGYFQGGHDASGTPTDEFQPIRQAFQTWQDLPGLDIAFHEEASTNQPNQSGDGHNTIMWVPHGWQDLSFHPPSNALAVTLLSFDSSTGSITDADIYFNAETFKWAVVDSPSESDYVDVQNIATHEIGHVLGLDHSSEDLWETDATLADATMYFASGTGETDRRTLKTDDTAAITNLYGVDSKPTPTIASADEIATGDTSIQMHITGSNFTEYTTFALTKDDSSFSDAISRYRTINSPTDATVTFETRTFPSGPARVVAFNSPTAIGSLSLSNVTTEYNASSNGGGGGCSLSVESSGEHKVFGFIFSFCIFVLTCWLLWKENRPQPYGFRLKKNR